MHMGIDLDNTLLDATTAYLTLTFHLPCSRLAGGGASRPGIGGMAAVR